MDKAQPECVKETNFIFEKILIQKGLHSGFCFLILMLQIKGSYMQYRNN